MKGLRLSIGQMDKGSYIAASGRRERECLRLDIGAHDFGVQELSMHCEIIRVESEIRTK